MTRSHRMIISMQTNPKLQKLGFGYHFFDEQTFENGKMAEWADESFNHLLFSIHVYFWMV